MSCTEGVLSNDLEKKFSNAIITWEVESFSLAAIADRVLCSPPISLVGPVETLWKMHLRIPRNKNRLLLNVEMLQNKSTTTKVNLHWAFCLLDENGKGVFSAERTFSYLPKTVLTLEYISLKRALEIVSMKKYDNLILQCCMLVDFGLKTEFPKLGVSGVEHLSNDLCNLPTSFFYHDTTINVNSTEFSLHKAILFFRGLKIVRLIEESISNVSDNFSLSKTRATTAILQYLYSGNLKFILDDPCLTIADYAENIEVSEQENVYSPQRITVSSKLEVKEQATLWRVPDFKSITRTVTGPEFEIEGVKSRLQLSLTVTESRDDPPKKSLSVEVLLIECEIIMVLSVDFSFRNEENQMLCRRRTHGLIGPKDRLGVILSEDDCPEMSEFFMSETLLIKAHVYRSVNVHRSHIVESQNPILTKIPYEKSLINLSNTMGEILQSGIHSDFHFEVDGHIIKAHKFLVAARSPLMKELFRRHEDVASVEAKGCTKEVFGKFLHYMYTGILAENDGDDLIELYKLGKRYNVESLSKAVPRNLSKCINEANMLRILIFAKEFDEDVLQNIALDYVMSKGDLLQNHEDLDLFKSMKPDLYREIQNSLCTR